MDEIFSVHVLLDILQPHYVAPITVMMIRKLMSMQIIYKVFLMSFMLTMCCRPAFAQPDMDFTNYEITPTFFNPAASGGFSGTFRAGLIFRDQHEFMKPSTATPFRTLGLAADAPLFFGFKKNHWLGAGITIITDNVGLGTHASTPNATQTLKQTWSRFAPSVAYHIGLDKKFTSIISFGLQYGLTSVNISDGFITAFRLQNGATGIDEMRIANAMDNELTGSYGSINFGVTYKSKVSKTSNFELGLAGMHLQAPDYQLAGGTGNASNRRINIHGKYRTATSKQLTFEPAVYASFMGPVSNIQAQFRTEYLTKPKGDLALILGAGYRLSDALQILTGARYKDYLFSLSFDYHLTDVSELSPYTFELGAAKVFTINKRPEIKPIIYCPRI